MTSNVEVLRQFADTTGGTVIEVGSRDGHDAAAMSMMFGADRVITVEANPDMYLRINRDYPGFENHCCAITDYTGHTAFNRVKAYRPATKIGQSSVLDRDIYARHADKMTVPCFTMDDFTDGLGVTEIAAMKVDVEGATYEVLSGFSKIRMTRLLHIEAEHREYWKGQRQYDDVAALLTDRGFEQVSFEWAYTDQSDSVWRRIGEP